MTPGLIGRMRLFANTWVLLAQLIAREPANELTIDRAIHNDAAMPLPPSMGGWRHQSPAFRAAFIAAITGRIKKNVPSAANSSSVSTSFRVGFASGVVRRIFQVIADNSSLASPPITCSLSQ